MLKLLKSLMPMMTTCLIAGIVLSILAPFGTHQFSTVFRFSYWIGLCLAGGFGAGIIDVAAHMLKKQLTPWPRAVLQSFTATLAVSSAIWLLTYLINNAMPSAAHFFQTLFYAWVISITIASVGALISKQSPNDGTAPSRAALLERLPPKLRSAKIYALAAEDHYVRVITSKGDKLVLMRLSDAIKETAPLKGLSPHRSWWVSEVGVEKTNKSEITLHAGQTVPISRSGMKLVREAGWV